MRSLFLKNNKAKPDNSFSFSTTSLFQFEMPVHPEKIKTQEESKEELGKERITRGRAKN